MKLKSIFTELFDDEDVSDEAIYRIYQFLDKLLFEFESKAYCRIKAHLRQQEEDRDSHFRQKEGDLRNTQVFTDEDAPLF